MLPVLKPIGGKEEADALLKVFKSGWWGKGPKVAEFEKKFAELVGAKYAVAVTSNTHGQDLVYKALEVTNCDIISPTMSFITTGMVPMWNNCTSTLCDIERRSLNIDPDDVKKAVKPNTKAICVVNMAGIPANVQAIREFYDGLIVEDCAHSCYTPGAGKQGDVAVWSFQAVKTMPCGDGGMISTDDKDLYEKLKPMTWLGIKETTYDRTQKKQGYSWDYVIDSMGWKAYMIDIMAEICLVQMEKLDKNLAIRRHVQKRYNEELDGYLEPPEWSETVQYYCARAPRAYRDHLIDFLASKKIHTSVHFKPLHLHPIMKQNRDFPVADSEWKRLISLPCHPGVTDEDIDYVVYWVKRFLEDLS
jgi:perosamine synthetase